MAEKIKIAVRCRPFAPHEAGQDCIISMEGNTTTIRDPSGGEKDLDFKFDKCFWSHDESKGYRFMNEHLMTEVGDELLGNCY